jgi:hypothetical protein
MATAIRKTPAEATAKWVQKLSAAAPEMEAGVMRVTEAPGVAAARQKAKWEQSLRESANKWEQRVQSVSLQDWQKSMKEIGVQRVATGAQAKQGKMLAFANEFYPFLEQVKSRIAAMPSTTPSDRISRMVANAEAIKGFKRSGVA